MCLCRDDVANPATRVKDVSSVARDHVQMDMKDCLAGRLAYVHTDVVAVGRRHRPFDRRAGMVDRGK
jgi:hypothetical protein